jgi:hypothetical protein
MKNRKILYVSLGALLIVFFGASYSLTNYINKNNLKFEASGKLPYIKLTAKSSDNNDSRQTSVTTNLAKVALDTKFVFKIKYKDNEVRNMVLERHFNDTELLNRKTEGELNEFFKNQGYTVSNMSSKQIVFVNNSDRYSYNANRYFLGVYDNLVTIYKTDNNGDIIAHKLFNSNVYDADGKQQDYDFEAVDKGEIQNIKVEDLKEKDGLIDNLIRGRKYSKDIDVSLDMEESEYEKGEFKTPEKAFDYARGLLKS